MTFPVVDRIAAFVLLVAVIYLLFMWRNGRIVMPKVKSASFIGYFVLLAVSEATLVVTSVYPQLTPLGEGHYWEWAFEVLAFSFSCSVPLTLSMLKNRVGARLDVTWIHASFGLSLILLLGVVVLEARGVVEILRYSGNALFLLLPIVLVWLCALSIVITWSLVSQSRRE